MRVLVTGGSGFVGTRVIERLIADGYDVWNLDVQPSSTYPALTTVGDICDVNTCVRALRGSDAVVHLAGLYRDDVRPRTRYYEVNVDGTSNVIRAAEVNEITRIVFTSSFSVYGLDDAGKSESGDLDPVNDYGRSKMAAEKSLLKWQAQDRTRSLQMIRPSVIFGEGNRGNVWTLVNQIAGGRFALIGDGSNRKSMAYVGNVADFLVTLLASPKCGAHVYNYADKPDMSVSEIVDLVADTLGRPIRRIPLPGSTAMLLGYVGDVFGRVVGRSLTLNSERIRKFLADTSLPTHRLQALGFVPAFDLRAALVKTIEYDFDCSAGSPRKMA